MHADNAPDFAFSPLGSFLVVLFCRLVALNQLEQAAALAMQEQEQIASQEAEKRLKAALAAKRDPSTATSRIASPSIGESGMAVEIPSELKTESKPSKDVVMDNGTVSTTTSSPKPEVKTISL